MAPAERLQVERVCCIAFTAVPSEQRKLWRWQVLHQLCHGRIGFSLAQLGTLAQLDPDEARLMWNEAISRGWATPALDCELLVGKLRGGKR